MADEGQTPDDLNSASDDVTIGPVPSPGLPEDQPNRRELIDGLYDYACRIFRSSTVAERGLNRAVSTAAADSTAGPAAMRVTALRILYEAASTVQMTPNDGEFAALEELKPEAAEWFGANVGPVLWRSAAQLPLDQYASIHLQVRLGLPPTEIADALGISHNYALVLISRARRAFDEILAPELIARIGSGACNFVSAWASIVRTPEEATDAMAEITEHVKSGCEACGAVLSTLGPLADLLSSLAPVHIPERAASALIQKLEQASASGTPPTILAPREPMPGVLAAPLLTQQSDDFSHVEEEPSGVSERMRQWLLERDIPIQAVGAAVGLVILVGGLGVVLALSRAGGPQPVDTRAAFAGAQTATPIIPTSIVPTQEPTPTLTPTAQAATPEPTATVAQPSATPAAMSIFRVGRPEGVTVPTETAATNQNTAGGARGTDTGRTLTSVPQQEIVEPQVPEQNQPEVLQPWITATPQNLGASGPGNNGQLVILNSGQASGTNENRPQTSRPSFDAELGSGSSPGSSPNSTSNASRPTPVPTAPPTPPPPRLGVSTTSLVFGPGETTKTVSISNAGTGQFSYRATPQQAWILISPAAGSVSNSTSMQVRVDRELAGRGAKSGTISVSSDAGTANISISVQ